MTIGSICAGIGGFDLGFQREGFRTRWHSEIDEKCRLLLRAKFPEAKDYGDITQWTPSGEDRVDVVCGGTPCQDLSVAGRRKGLDGERSGLFYQMVRVCKTLRVRMFLWENVPGALSSNGGRDFAAVLRAWTGLKVEVPADGWGGSGFVRTPFPAVRWNVAWRSLDSQYFGLAQRRERLFLVGSLGDASCLEVLFEPESLSGNTPPSREAGQRVAPTVEGRAGSCFGGNNTSGPIDVSTACNAKGGVGRMDFDSETFIAHTLDGSHGATEDGTGRGTPLVYGISGNYEADKDHMPTMTQPSKSGGGHPPVVAFTQNQREEVRELSVAGTLSSIRRGDAKNETIVAIQSNLGSHGGGVELDMSTTLKSTQGPPAVAIVPFDTTQVTSKSNYSEPKPGEPCHPLASSAHPPAIAFQSRIARNGRGQPETICPALNGTNAGETSDMRPLVACTLNNPGKGGRTTQVDSLNYVVDTLPFQGIRRRVQHGNATEADAAEILRLLREAHGEEAHEQWRTAVLASFQPPEVLRPLLHGKGLDAENPEHGEPIGGEVHGQKKESSRPVREMREGEREGCSPQGRQSSEQRPGESGADLPGMPQPSSPEKEGVQCVWQTPEGIRVLRHALSTLQEMGRSDDGEGQSTHSNEKGFGREQRTSVRRLTPT